MKKITLLFAAAMAIASLQAQVQFEKAYRLGSRSISYGSVQTSDGGYALTGFSEDYSSNDESNVYFVKLDSNGDTVFTKSFAEASYDNATDIKQTSDGGYIITGSTYSSSANYEIYLIRTDNAGNALWTKTYGSIYMDLGNSVVETPDGGFAVSGVKGNSGYLMKTDNSGNFLWGRTYTPSYYSGQQRLVSLANTSDGGFIMTGFTEFYGGYDGSMHVIKTDMNGIMTWSNAFGNSSKFDAGNRIIETSDNGFVVIGHNSSSVWGEYEAFLTKLNAAGAISWARKYTSTESLMGISVAETPAGDLISTGSIINGDLGTSGIFLMKTSSTGIVNWAKSFGGTGEEYPSAVHYTADNGYIVTGGSGSYGAGSLSFLALKTDSTGSTGCHTLSLPMSGTVVTFNEVQYQPSTPPSLTITDNENTEATVASILGSGGTVTNLCAGDVIEGPASVCTNSTAVYYIATYGASINWTVPSGAHILYGQGSTSIAIGFDSTFTSGQIVVTADGFPSYLDITTSAMVPGSIQGNTFICSPAQTYSITPIEGASYSWNLPAGANLINGQGTSSIDVYFDSTFTGGNVELFTNTDCGGFFESVYVSAGPTPPVISGMSTDLCYLSTPSQVYTITNVDGDTATTYTWSVSPGLSISYGQGGDTVVVDLDSSFTSGSISVYASNACGTSQVSTLLLNSAPEAVQNILGQNTEICPTAAPTIVYTVSPISVSGNYNWTAPAGASIIDGQGSPSVTVAFDSTFSGGQLSVIPVNSCSSGAEFSIGLYLPQGDSLLMINGPAYGLCPYSDSLQYSYSIIPIIHGTSYNWTAPTGATIISGQGTENIVVDFDTTFTGGLLTVTTITECGPTVPGSLMLNTGSESAPLISGFSSGICPDPELYIYAADSIQGMSYSWSTDPGMNIVYLESNKLYIRYDSNFVSGNVYVTMSNECESISSSLAINVLPEVDSLMGQQIICNPAGQYVSYSVVAGPGYFTYNWTAPAGAVVVGGQGTPDIVLLFDGTFVSGDVSVYASTYCNEGTPISLNITSNGGNDPVISGPSCVLIDSIASYSVDSISGVNYYDWIAPAGASIQSGWGTANVDIYFQPGFTSGTLSVTTYDFCGSSADAQFTISPGPAISGLINGPSTGICTGDTLLYSIAPVSGATSYTWTVPAGATIAYGQGTENLYVSFDSTFTSDTISVIANNACGSSAAVILPINTAPPTLQTGISGFTSGLCLGGPWVYAADSIPGATYSWSADPGITLLFSYENKVQVNFDSTFTSGNLYVTLSSSCWSLSDSIALQFSPVVSAVSGPTALCTPQSFSYSATGEPFFTYNWAAPAGATITSGQGTSNIIIEFDSTFTSGNLTVSPSTWCSTGEPYTLSLISLTQAPGPILGPACVLTTGGSFFYETDPVPGAIYYEWLTPAGATINSGASDTLAEFVFDSSFTGGTIRVRAYTECGMGYESSITVNATPATPGAINGITTGLCPQGTASADYWINPVPNATSYTWTAPSGATINYGQGSDSVNVSFDSTFTSGNLSVIATNECGSSASQFVLLRSVPQKPGQITGNIHVCAGDTSLVYSVAPVEGASSYTWLAPSGVTIVSGQGSNSITVNWGSSTGDLSVTASNDCGTSNDRSRKIHVVSCSHAYQPIASAEASEQVFNVFPNPNNGTFTVQFEEMMESSSVIRVLNVLGETVFEESIQGDQKKEIDLGNTGKGIYMVQVQTGGNKYFRKIIVQ